MNERPEQNREEACRAMERALMPRTPEGLIDPFIRTEAAPEVLYCPKVRPDENGCSPGMIFAADFADGKIPDYLDYAPGIEVRPDAMCLENRFFYPDRFAPIPGPPPEEPPRKAPVTADKGAGTVPVQPGGACVYEEDGFGLYERKGGLYFANEKGEGRLCNFTVQITEQRVILEKNRPERRELLLKVRCKGRAYELTVPSGELSQVGYTITRAIPSATVSPAAAKGYAILSNYVRNMVDDARTVYTCCSPGFERIHGKWVYVHDGIPVPFDDTAFRTGCTIPRDPLLSRQEAFQKMLELRNLSPKQTLIVPLMLLMHLGPLFDLFKAADCPPRFVTFLNGTTGSLKTSLCLCLFRLFAEQDAAAPDASFYDTQTAIELKLAATSGRVLLVDDFQPPVTAAAGQRKQETLEMLIRYVGDQNGKARGSAELTLRAQTAPACCAVVTGEDISGSQSSVLRCVLLNIEKGDIDPAGLQRYQDNPLLLQTHLFHFLNWCGTKGEELIRFIRSSFDRERRYFASRIRERRQIDAAAVLQLTAEILCRYGGEIQALSPGEAEELRTWFRVTVAEAVALSEENGRNLDPAAMYLTALFSMLENGKISLAPDEHRYRPGEHHGFRKDGLLWLRGGDVFPLVIRYWRELGVRFPLSQPKINECLFSRDLILADHENRNGREKKLYSKRAPVPGRPRMLVMQAAAAKQYLEDHLIN